MEPDNTNMLPPPAMDGSRSLEEVIAERRSVRRYKRKPLTLAQVSQLCWAAQGITDPHEALRAAPSAGALYPIEIYVMTAEGVQRYRPADHRLERHLDGDVRLAVQRASVRQEMIGEAPVCMVIAAVVKRTARKYGGRAERYCFIESGHVAQNIMLQATALHLASVPVGAYEDADVAKILKLPKDHRVLYMLPIGHPFR